MQLFDLIYQEILIACNFYRPLNSIEKSGRHHSVAQCLSQKEIELKERQRSQTFTFDRVFGQDSKQVNKIFFRLFIVYFRVINLGV